MDFVSDWVVGPGQEKVRIINIMDECSRKALWTEAHHSITAKKLTQVLDKVVQWRGHPEYIRCDNGTGIHFSRVAIVGRRKYCGYPFTQPGKPSQNGLIERLNGTLRTECLNLEWFVNIPQLNEKLQKWWMDYNTIRPHSSIGYKTPDELEQLNENLYFKAVA